MEKPLWSPCNQKRKDRRHFNSRTAVEVLSILRDQYRAERDYANSRYDYILNMLRLKEAVGDLSKDDVKQINYWLKH